jgi:hypothetical protein
MSTENGNCWIIKMAAVGKFINHKKEVIMNIQLNLEQIKSTYEQMLKEEQLISERSCQVRLLHMVAAAIGAEVGIYHLDDMIEPMWSIGDIYSISEDMGKMISHEEAMLVKKHLENSFDANTGISNEVIMQAIEEAL